MKINELSNILKSNGISASNNEIEKAVAASGQNLESLKAADITPDFIEYLKGFLPMNGSLSTDVLSSAIEVGFLNNVDSYVETNLEELSEFETYIKEAHQMLVEMRVKRLAPLIYQLTGQQSQLTGNYASQEQQLIDLIEAERTKLKNRPKAADRLAELKAKLAA